SCAGSYTETKTWRAVDGCGNSSNTVSQTISFGDTTPPTIGGQGANITIECTGTASFTAPTASDACTNATVILVSDVTIAGSCAGSYTETKTWRAVDGCGNSSNTVSQTISFGDTTPPTIGGQGANITIECTGTASFTAPTASDACTNATVILVSDVTIAGSCPGSYTETKTWRAVDGCGNSSNTVSQTISVTDTTAPTIGTAGTNATIECTATPTFTAPTASDFCNTSTVVQVGGDVTGGTACAKTTTRTWLAVDACGNSSATRAQTITQIDTQAP